VAIAVVGVTGYAVGRWGTAPSVEIREVTHTEWRTRVEVQEVVRWRERVVERRVTDRRTETTDAGTVVVVERIDERTRTDRDGSGESSSRAEGEGTRDTTRIVTPTQPQWRVGVDVGASLRDPIVPIYGPVVVGARVDRWIAGPVWIGAWASTAGAAGVGVAMEW
jgi:hypothetical protein